MTDNKRADYIFEDFVAFNYPLRDDVVSYELYDDDSILIQMIDGYTIWYDSIFKACRYLRPDNDGDIDDAVWRKMFGLFLQRRMRKRGVLQRELSEMTGISTVTLSSYMQGKSLPNVLNLKRLADALDCTMDDFAHFPD